MTKSDEDRAIREGEGSPKTRSKADALELNEAEINAPSRKKLVMLAVISASALTMWAAGRAACGYQVPSESLTPRPVTMEERTWTAKDVGLEIAQLVSGAQFEQAKKLAVDAGVDWVTKQKSSCKACSKPQAAGAKSFSTATVLRSSSVDAIVKVRTVGASGGEVVHFLGIERMGTEWKLSRVYKDAASAHLKDRPSSQALPGAIHRLKVPAQEGKSTDAGSAKGEGDSSAASTSQTQNGKTAGEFEAKSP